MTPTLSPAQAETLRRLSDTFDEVRAEGVKVLAERTLARLRVLGLAESRHENRGVGADARPRWLWRRTAEGRYEAERATPRAEETRAA